MSIPSGLQPLVDADILRYEISFAAETGWKAITGDTEAIPPFEYVEKLLLDRIENIKAELNTDKAPRLYVTKGRTFRYDIAQRKPYKGQRKEDKPFHFNNLSAYLTGVLNAKVITGIEADDALAIDHVASNNTTVLCSRDKDLKQVPGYFFSWELGRQGSFGPLLINKAGSLTLSEDHKKIGGTGYAFFLAQCLVGDSADNTPGLPKCGPVAAYDMLVGKTPQEQLAAVQEAYSAFYGPSWEQELLEQGVLHWLIRRFNEDGSPQLWNPDLFE